MKQIVNHPDQQFYSFDSYIVDNGLQKYFTLSHEFEEEGYFNATDQKKKNRKRIFTRIATGGVSTIFEKKEQRKATNEQIKTDAKDKELRQKALALATGGISLVATKDGRKFAGQMIKKSLLGVPFLAYIGLLRINMAKQAARMYPGLLTEKEAREQGFDMENWKKTVALVKKVEKVLEKWGGATDKDKKLFRDAIRLGRNKPPFRSRKRAAIDKAIQKEQADKAKAQNNFVSFNKSDTEWFNYEGIWEAAAIAAGTSVLGIVASLISKAGVKKNPYADGKVRPGLEGDDEEIPTASKEQQKEAIEALIMQDPKYTDEEKKVMLEELDGAVEYMNDPNEKKKAEKSAEGNDLLLYGGIAFGVIAISALAIAAFSKPKTAKS